MKSEEEIRKTLADIRAERESLPRREREEIADAWRAAIPPGEIAALVGRSEAHIRGLRPDDVAPLRTGGGYATKHRNTKRASQRKPPKKS
jgi:hypothetical protein